MNVYVRCGSKRLVGWLLTIAAVVAAQGISVAWAQTPTCDLDPTRTVFAGGPGTQACRQFDGDESACNQAFHQSRFGVASCFFDNGSCFGCGPSNEGLQCTNTCLPPPQCAGDPMRTIFTGGPQTAACQQLSDDPQACNQAFHRDRDGQFASCFSFLACRPCGAGSPRSAGSQSGGAQDAINGDGQFCINTCQPPPDCLDQARTIFAGGPGTDACQQFNGDETSCEQAFHLGRNGVATCFYDTNTDDCRGCGPSNENQGNCTNTCVPPPTCTDDPSRTIFAGGPGTNACRQYDNDQSSCEQAFHRGSAGIASCFYNSDEDECRGCGPANEGQGNCTNTCDPATCAEDPSRTIFAGGPDTGACRQYDNDQSSCEQAFHRGVAGIASCFYDSDEDECRGCGPSNERQGNCTNTCVPPPTCDEDPSRTIFAGGPDTNACRQYDNDQASCGQAFHRGDDDYISSCFYNTSTGACRGCGPSNQNKGRCTNTCAPPPTCLDESRSTFGACDQFAGNVAACEQAFQLQQGGLTASCAVEPLCLGCGPSNQQQGLCTNECAVAPTVTTPAVSWAGLFGIVAALLGLALYKLYRRGETTDLPNY
jgi:hypothetical protein